MLLQATNVKINNFQVIFCFSFKDRLEVRVNLFAITKQLVVIIKFKAIHRLLIKIAV